ncbi:neutral zinc metallopeptidase [Nocardia sp. NPDC052566]|uniref:neutral zinc metallopeptidase n=1 Tax=Nocardia sp. NPDC052566 TaxID=3364330 RepID=UPI0037CB21DD
MKSPRTRRSACLPLVVLLTALVVAGCDRGRLPKPAASPTTTQAAAAAPETLPEPTLEDNPLHRDIRLPPMHCELPQVDSNAASQQRFVQAAIDCLNDSWLPVLRAAGALTAWAGAERPALRIIDRLGLLDCAGEQVQPTDSQAFYCAGSIFWPTEGRGGVWIPDRGNWTAREAYRAHTLFVVMHEYGHHVQELTGIERRADLDKSVTGWDSESGLRTSRRAEQQAQCLGGVATAAAKLGGTVSPREADYMIAVQEMVAEERIHGTAASSLRWSEAGYHSASTSSCNTWTAPPSEVE